MLSAQFDLKDGKFSTTIKLEADNIESLLLKIEKCREQWAAQKSLSKPAEASNKTKKQAVSTSMTTAEESPTALKRKEKQRELELNEEILDLADVLIATHPQLKEVDRLQLIADFIPRAASGKEHLTELNADQLTKVFKLLNEVYQRLRSSDNKIVRLTEAYYKACEILEKTQSTEELSTAYQGQDCLKILAEGNGVLLETFNKKRENKIAALRAAESIESVA